MATKNFLCLRPSFVIREKSPARSSDHCACMMSCRTRSDAVYRVSVSQYDWMIRMGAVLLNEYRASGI